MKTCRVMTVAGAALLAISVHPLLAPTGQAKAAPPAAVQNQLHIVEYGEYTTKDAPGTLKPKWTLKNQATDIKIASGAGFGIRYLVPGPYEGKTQINPTIALVGPFGGPGGPVGYEFAGVCTVAKEQCLGEMIFAIDRGTGLPTLGPGRYTIRVTYNKVTVEKTFVLAN